jgi:cyclic beta-1,2-glucan synthetase
MYRIALESLLGLRIRDGRTLELNPCVPDEWPGYGLDYRVPGGQTRYEIRVTNPRGAAGAVVAARLDGAPVAVERGRVRVPLASDDQLHRLDVELGPRAAS